MTAFSTSSRDITIWIALAIRLEIQWACSATGPGQSCLAFETNQTATEAISRETKETHRLSLRDMHHHEDEMRS
ncbi:hypothetical protein BJY01DRAFT_208980 [Aspergillus pseudoustus]|uniref:Secreted protein n=1 Tax=Aspergillus pseudoustus TaxID=1810923 RepID=A0ABR4KK63_9EURO